MRESARALAVAAMTASAADGRRSNEVDKRRTGRAQAKRRGKGGIISTCCDKSVGQSISHAALDLVAYLATGQNESPARIGSPGAANVAEPLPFRRVSGAGPHAAKSCDGNVSSLTLLGDEVRATVFLRHRLQRWRCRSEAPPA